jgi:hypothetical protein
MKLSNHEKMPHFLRGKTQSTTRKLWTLLVLPAVYVSLKANSRGRNEKQIKKVQKSNQRREERDREKKSKLWIMEKM